MLRKRGEYFIFNRHRYYRTRSGLSLDYAKDRLEQRRHFAPDYLWAINRDSDNTWSLGRRSR